MSTVKFICDLFEFTAIFLLAVEAIKLHNLKWVRTHATKAQEIINPNVEFVDEVPKNATFLQKHNATLWFFGFYIFGLVICLFAVKSFENFFYSHAPTSLMTWIIWAFAGLLVPLLCGLSAYGLLVWLVMRVISMLFWIEENTRNGAVGILGFGLFALQFFARRALSL